MNLACLDLEGVLVPEIWEAVAEETGIEGLNLTTRDEPDYDALMRYRLDILEKHEITLPLIQKVIERLDPLEGADDFLQWLREHTQVIILSDTFAEFARPLMRRLGWPTLFCHELSVDEKERIKDYQLRQHDQKSKAVRAFQSLNLRVISVGDSYNDLGMLQTAEEGILFCPPSNLPVEHPEFKVAYTHMELKTYMKPLLGEE